MKTKPREFSYSERVEDWRTRVEVLRDVAGVSADRVPTEVVLSLIHVESSGDESPGGGRPFYGLLQIGSGVAADVNGVWGTNYRAKDFEGRGNLSIEAFYAWCKRYEKFHEWDPEYIAIGWKGGVGTLSSFKARLARGVAVDKLNRWLEEDRWNTYSYLVWFRKAMDVWTESHCD